MSITIFVFFFLSFNWLDWQGIFDGQQCSSSSKYTNHCVLIVGYDSSNGEDYWIVKNSWGTKWGINGYIWIKRNTGLPYGVCGMNAWAYNPTIRK